MNRSPAGFTEKCCCIAAMLILPNVIDSPKASAAGGVLKLVTLSGDPPVATAARLELRSDKGRKPALRRTIRSGPGVVLDREIELALNPGVYRFRVVRGPEYRVVSGNFEVQVGAADERRIDLVRMVDMQAEGYLAGDMAWGGPVDNDLTLRMSAEDLHVAAVLRNDGGSSRVASRTGPDAGPERVGPIWTSQRFDQDSNWLYYPEATSDPTEAIGAPATGAAAGTVSEEAPTRAVIANPFAWELPLWLANRRVDGILTMGDWLQEDKQIDVIPEGRPPAELGFTGNDGPGRYAESIYWRLLEAGFRIPPLAGSGASVKDAAIGYNRTYAIGPSRGQDDRRVAAIESERDYYQAVWGGRTMLTNGPLLRPTLGGQAPGHVFQARSGETLTMSVELHLAVRDPVDYLEVIHNGEAVHSVRLDEFAKAGGMIPELTFRESGWVMVRVVTQHADHFRAAISAPWHIEFDNVPRISRGGVEFFTRWLTDSENEWKKLPAEQLGPLIQPVRSARQFWRRRLEMANAE